ncbi:MAG: hypothetical protein Q7W51_11005 [Coriobacteriia bacterium]|nr:hypothetical protein [Coriobacteriia bacterium]
MSTLSPEESTAPEHAISVEDELATSADAPPSPGRGRLLVLVLAVAVFAILTAMVLSRGGSTSAPPEEPYATSATLDAALAAGEPVYVLIHSLT